MVSIKRKAIAAMTSDEVNGGGDGVDGSGVNEDEEIRRLRVQENLKHLEGLGISKLSKSIMEVAKLEHKQPKCRASPKINIDLSELRRSSRARNSVASYRDDVGMKDLRIYRQRNSKSCDKYREYTGRIASYEQIVLAARKADKLLSGLNSSHPSFVKTMVRSHVSSCYWLGLPTKFCKDHLPPEGTVSMVLEDENGVEVDAVYIAVRTGLSGGWRGFATNHNLEDGDALIFELTEPDRFKIYIVKATGDTERYKSKGGTDENESAEDGDLDPDIKSTMLLRSKRAGRVFSYWRRGRAT